MKGGAIFKTSDDTVLRKALGIFETKLQGRGVTSAVYVSPSRLLGIQEITSQQTKEYGNLHAIVVTLPSTEGKLTVEFFPEIPTNYFKSKDIKDYGITDRLKRELNGNPIPYTPILIDKDAVPTRTQSRSIALLESGTPMLPETAQQTIAAMAGLTAMPRGQRPITTTVETALEAIPLSDVKSALARVAPKEVKAVALIDAAIKWVKAWNEEHIAPDGEKGEATKKRKAAEKVLDGIEGGKTKVFVPLPHKESSSNAAPPPPQGPNAAEGEEEERLSQDALAAMRAGRRTARRKQTRKSKTRASRRTSLGRKTRRR
jgi:hypothetical protein